MGEDVTIEFSRRRVMLLGGASAALLTAAYHGMRQVGFYEPDPLDTEVLTPKEIAVLRRVGAYVVPPSEWFPGHGGDDETVSRIDQLLARLPKHKRGLLRALPHVFEHGTGLDRVGARRATALPEPKFTAYLDEWANASHTDWVVRSQLWAGLMTVYGMTYWERPEVLDVIGAPILCAARR
jgi:hypothetical protein